eukprot:CAMPEP_0170432968 /NCGR_PEP_ID=MMETSP0117_2-20130122/42244_1 /TAXON_ID=400756 /ORGANISM="Durinskia baltica, Strain CSIRO CS-38" /LENGTH=933 /DNA_ID=CAMNT_0010692679 /DNA_START=51 /DNA_END=2853 /DNA_ORIENTATION=-
MVKSSKSTKVVSRKESRKIERKQAKQVKQVKHSNKQNVVTQSDKPVGPLQKILQAKSAQNEESKRKPSITKAPPPRKDPYLEQEEMELARLSKLLGIDKNSSRKKSAEKLNKEYDLFEGMGDGFGDFLMELDDLTDMVEGKSDRKNVFHGREELADKLSKDAVSHSKKASKYGGHLIDEDEQEASDIDDGSVEEEEGEEEDDSDMGSDTGSVDESMENLEDDDDDGDNDDDDDKDEQADSDGDSSVDSDNNMMGEADQDSEPSGEEDHGSDDDISDDDSNDENIDDEAKDADKFTYKPSAGEDIYGRSTISTDSACDKPGKYVPPAKRKAAMLEVDEKSENVQLLRRQLNSLMNKLSEQSKDSIVRSIKTLFDQNSVTVATLVLKDAIFSACSHPTQVMTSLIPIYAAIVAALHNSVSIDVGGTLVEHLTLALVKSLAEATAAAKDTRSIAAQRAGHIGSKLPANALLLLVYLYNLRVIHHTLIVDVMNALADCTPLPTHGTSSTQERSEKSTAGLGDFVELKVELLECLINHCGVSIRSDDPVSLKMVISTLSKRLAHMPAKGDDSDENGSGNSRLRFMFEALTDLKNNKSRRIQTSNAEVVKKLRKWLGSTKALLGQKQAGDTCMRVSLMDLMNAETKGRWWRTGASWVGKQQDDAEKEEFARKNSIKGDDSSAKRAKTSAEKSEEDMLIQLATKLRMNTKTRKNIFVVMMSSRDVTDAFERLSRLELKGKEDREVARVLAQCCAQERTYNAFYAELAKLLCAQHRQYKITFQFVFWDTFKAMDEEEDEDDQEQNILRERKAVNLARLMAALICSFHLPLTVIKPIDISSMSPSTILFLSTLMLALFKDKMSDDDYQNLLDRVATSKDFAVVRDNILFFLQKYLPSIPKGLDPTDLKKMQQRRKTAIRTFEAMSVLDISKGAMRDDENDFM